MENKKNLENFNNLNENILKVNNSENFVEKFTNTKNALFACTISSIETTKTIPISGVNAKVIDYTPAADMELVTLGKSISLSHPPIDATNCPSPATITRAVVDLLNMPCITIDAGSNVKPKIPYILAEKEPTGDINLGKGIKNSKLLIERGKLIGKNLTCDKLILGESVPGGTTTAMGVLIGLGYDVKDKISSGSVANPKDLKVSVIQNGLNMMYGTLTEDKNKEIKASIYDILNAVGDNMLAINAGICISLVERNIPVLLAGGGQMAGVLAVIKEISPETLTKELIGISTTEFVYNDHNADLQGILNQIYAIPTYISTFGYENSSIEGLRAYCSGSVKEGVGAGAMATYAYLNGLKPEDIRNYIEKYYYEWYKEIL
ncbi:nicotinate mononucleotide-dependent phosphoribosyltransferase CobT [Methanococcus voltae]|uniref:UPF0284 protein J3E07_001023 n=2 Tax=Methanococcus voltae TaxID=2188 RepID=A0A8J7RIM9_METVO|nr:TIGR00303 family protein [Methanococcus voltae]MBP2172482.1 uncharacterized protein (TIGR00303 family) [Methanococcus voltae]MBP2201611.1 uncharacterized protein (TIGR00303 family) [Methanococcus voltae]MCS3922400.1 uncharacterized protein (TIGR00303 family) [Methanococcus voltae PS]